MRQKSVLQAMDSRGSSRHSASGLQTQECWAAHISRDQSGKGESGRNGKRSERPGIFSEETESLENLLMLTVAMAANTGKFS